MLPFEPNIEMLRQWMIRGLVLMTCLPVHEFAHAVVADKLGDKTARNQGRLTINPFAHLEIFGSLMLIFAGVGWAKPVPVNPGRFKNPKWGMALTAAAGPISNILLAIIFASAFIVVAYTGSFHPTHDIFFALELMIIVNLTLAVFNLLPVPPLDGSRIIGVVLPDHIYFGVMKYERFIMIAVIILVFTGMLTGVLFFLVGHMFRFVVFVTRPVELLMERIIYG